MVRIYHLICLVQGFYIIYVLILAYRRKREGVGMFMLGFAALFAAAINDILYSNRLIETTELTPFGLFVFLFSQAFLLSQRFSGAFNTVERQREVLSQTNRAYSQEIVEHKKARSELVMVQNRLEELVAVEVRLAPDLMNVRGSRIYLCKSVANLIANAVEAQSTGGKILVSTANRYVDQPISGYDTINEGDYAVVRVQDFGSGISSEDIERIFEPFYTKKAMGRSGTGLGMALVWGTIQDHKGYIHVNSTPGFGTTFELYLPIAREEVRDDVVPIKIDACLANGEKVLIVDDIIYQREIAACMLQKLGYATDAVASGEEAVEYIQNNEVDLIVLDMIMDPGIDGLEAYRRIKKLRPDQKAIIASGFSEGIRVKKTQELGAGAYVKKPYTIEKIARALQDELKN
jgi:CheY-like chemotaxis protein